MTPMRPDPLTPAVSGVNRVRHALNAVTGRHSAYDRETADAIHAVVSTAQAVHTNPTETSCAAHKASSDEAAGKPGL
jgi:hypothetical protein